MPIGRMGRMGPIGPIGPVRSLVPAPERRPGIFARVRELMAVPFARPPGRRSLLREFAAGWWALAIYAAFIATYLVLARRYQAPPDAGWHDRSGRAMSLALAAAYGLGGIVLFLGPLWSGAMAWARERQAGTLEALLLTPLNSTERVQGRFWHVFGPWARLLLYLLPLYLVLACTEPFQSAGTLRGGWDLWLLCIFVTKPSWMFWTVTEALHSWEWSLAGLVPVLLRFANDFTIAFFACAAAYYISVRARSATRALVGAGLVAMGMLTVLSLHDWLLAAEITETFRIRPDTVGFLTYGSLGALAAVVRVWLGFRLLRLAAENFDAYVLGEASERS